MEVSDPRSNRWVAVEPIGGYDGPVVAPGTAINGQSGFTDRRIERVWRRSFFDLSRWAGLPIRVRFHAGLGTNTPGDGWFLDDVRIYRGGVVEDAIDTDLSTCGAGAVIRFPFRTCDEGFGTRGSGSSWACGPATPLADHPKAPVGDGPQFDVDGSGLLFATAPSGLHNPAEVSELVSPPMDLSGCQGRTTSLSFWHWYHFAPGGGGWVEVWDGRQWVEVFPTRGYGGPVRLAPIVTGERHEGFVTPEDRPSGWRFEVFDVSSYVHAEFRVRFRFLGGLARRPGWYIDTVAVSTSLLEGLPRLDGDPKLPGCGFDPVSYAQPDGNRTLPDPCVMGRPVVGPQVIEVSPRPPKAAPPGERSAAGATVETPDAPSGVPDLPTMPATAESVDFETPAAGAVCLVIANGSGVPSSRVERGRVWLDGQEVISANRFVSSATLLRQRLAVAAGKHTLRIEADGPSDAASNSTGTGTRFFLYQVLFQAGNAMPAPVPPAPGNPEGGAGLALNFTTGRLRSNRVAKLEFETAVPAVGLGKQGYVVPFVVQLADARTCRQVRELRGTVPVGTDTRGGWEDALASAGLTWDGRDESGRPVQAQSLFARISFGAALAGLETFPLPTSGEMEPHAGDWPELPPWVPTGPPVPRFGPFVTRPIAVRWGPRLFTPHQDGFCTTLACSLDRDPDLSWSCAPNVGWRTSGSAAGWTVDTRRLCLAGYYPSGSDYDVVFEQGGSTLVRPPGTPIRVASSGWWLEAALPAVGDDPAVIGPATPHPGAATATVFRDGASMGTTSSFTFRPPYAACIQGAGSDGGFVPGERASSAGICCGRTG